MYLVLNTSAFDTKSYQIRRNGWRRPDPWNATKDFIAPAVAGLTGMIMLPPQLVFVASKVVVLSMPIEDISKSDVESVECI